MPTIVTLERTKFKGHLDDKWNGIWIGLTDIKNEGKWIWNGGTQPDSAFDDWKTGKSVS